jgi:hypothetical protein
MTKGSQTLVRATKQQLLAELVDDEKEEDEEEAEEEVGWEETPRYFVETVCDRILLNNEIVVPW